MSSQGLGAETPGPLTSALPGADLDQPAVMAVEIVEDLRAALEEFELISLDLAQRAQAISAD